MEDKSTCFSVGEVSAIHLTCKDVKDRDDLKYLFQTGASIQDSNTDLILCIIGAINMQHLWLLKVTQTLLSQNFINFNGNLQ